MNYFLLLIVLIGFIGCDQKEKVRKYTEVITAVPSAPASNDPHAGMDMGQDPHAGLDMSATGGMGVGPVMGLDASNTVAWSVPDGWKEEPAKGLRLATFHDAQNPQDIDVSIVPLGGSIAGGLESNLKRWLGQINLKVSDTELQSFMQSSPNNIYDFTQLQKGQPSSTKSMMVAVITLPDKTVFVKMTGTQEALGRQKDKFMDLVKSVQPKKPSSQEAGSMDAVKDPHAGLDMSSMTLPGGNAPTDSSLKWVVPKGWQEQAASGMRVATFRLASDLKKIDCYIVTLGGMAGGVEANLGRWIGQIGLKASSENIEKVMKAHQSIKTQDGLEAQVYDLSSIQEGSSVSDKSMIAAIIPTQEASIFVKMTGSIEAVSQNKESFIELVKSIHHQ